MKMKDSGVEWIGQVPEHWEVKPFFALVSELNRKNVGLAETNILSLSYGNIIQKPETRNMGLTPESYETYQIVESGEVVFRFTDLQNDNVACVQPGYAKRNHYLCVYGRETAQYWFYIFCMVDAFI
uniref:Restriction endonuclease subunit S n=1 Tax=Klebsiella pneumoniae TaxID=573 RepID=A0A2P1BP96_KLEPN|nr:hypothetical protein [Klebsiella pneumoniae]